MTAGIYLSPLEVKQLANDLLQGRERWMQRLEAKQFPRQDADLFLSKLYEALFYAREHGYGILEASEVFDPNA